MTKGKRKRGNIHTSSKAYRKSKAGTKVSTRNRLLRKMTDPIKIEMKKYGLDPYFKGAKFKTLLEWGCGEYISNIEGMWRLFEMCGLYRSMIVLVDPLQAE